MRPEEIIARLTMPDGMIEDMDPGSAETIIRALDGAGFAIVPVAPTAEMLRAASDTGAFQWDISGEHDNEARSVWRAMLNAAQCGKSAEKAKTDD
jgi:hypothetical protein